ncbi:hypothetical protein [Synechococcus sp. CBW1006]|uniref:hypothetical protein n=1 Tax=Synechococcus sp. CBW1006 TaxID=1353138 RepID=UPI0018CF750C|nr:hypothetical protein [Synechococcus sp. CBW1006]QPN66534.1 hypothetical protein H8F26_17725 [Synechococcus sp. CBW1006]
MGPRALPLDSQKLLAVDCGVDCVAYRYPLAAATLGGDGIIRFPVRIEVEVSRPWPEEQFRSRYGPGTVIRRDLSLGIAVWRKTPKTGWILDPGSGDGFWPGLWSAVM